MINDSITEPYWVHLDSVHDCVITIKRERNEPAGEWSERGVQKNFFNDSWDTTNERTKLGESKLVKYIGGKENYT